MAPRRAGRHGSQSLATIVLLQLLLGLVSPGSCTPDDAKFLHPGKAGSVEDAGYHPGLDQPVTVVISHGLPQRTHIELPPTPAPQADAGTYSLPGLPPPAQQPDSSSSSSSSPAPAQPQTPAALTPPATEPPPEVEAPPSPSPSPSPSPAAVPGPGPEPAPAGPMQPQSPAPAPVPAGSGNPPLGPAFAVKPAAPAPTAGSSGSGNPPLGPAFAVKPAGPAAPSTTATTEAAAGAQDATPKPFLFTQPGASKDVVFGCVLPFTGDQRDIGMAARYALEMAIRDNPIPGSNVNLTCLDGRCTDIPTYNAVTRLAADGAAGIIGEACSGASVAAAGVATAKKVPIISPSASATTLSQVDYFYRTVSSDRWQGAAIANEMWDNGLRSPGLIYSDSTYGYGLAFNFIASFTKLGGSIPLVVVLKAGETSSDAALAQVKDAAAAKKIDSLFISTTAITWAGSFLKALDGAGIKLPIVGGDGLADASLVTAMNGDTAPLARLTTTGFNPGLPGFRAKFANYTGGAVYHVAAAHAYDAMKALIKAYEAAGPPHDGPGVLAQLAKTKFDGMSGPIEFNEFGDRLPSDQSYVINRFDMTTGKLVYGDAVELHLLRQGTNGTRRHQ